MSRHRIAAGTLLAIALAACGRTPSTPAPAPGQPAAQAEATARLGDATMHVSAVQTSQLPDAIARQYGIARSPRSVLLLVNLQGGDDAVPTRVEATVTDLRGGRQALALRELAVATPDGDRVRDYIATVETTLPETLRFEVVAMRGDARASVQVSRDFYP